VVSWAVIAGSIAGTSHVQRGTPCQDVSGHAVFGAADEWLAVAVADGAGSATHSDRGAAVCVEELLRGVQAAPIEAFTREGMLDLFTSARTAVQAAAEVLGVPPRELACTALLAVVGPDGAAFGQIGDGAIVLGDGTSYRTAHWPEPGEYANLTDFLTDDGFAEKFAFKTIAEPINEVAVLSDGLQRLCLDFANKCPHEPFFRPLFRRLWDTPDPRELDGPLREFLDSPAINSRTDDDKSLVLAVRRA
jgi:Protein phosphatase 2C